MYAAATHCRAVRGALSQGSKQRRGAAMEFADRHRRRRHQHRRRAHGRLDRRRQDQDPDHAGCHQRHHHRAAHVLETPAHATAGIAGGHDRHHALHQRRRRAPPPGADRGRAARLAGHRRAAADGRLARRSGAMRSASHAYLVPRRPRVRRPRDLAARSGRDARHRRRHRGARGSPPRRSPRSSRRSTPSMEKQAAAIFAAAVPGAPSRSPARSAASGCWSARTPRSSTPACAIWRAQTVAAFRQSIAELGITAPLYLTQNDGTLMSADFAEQYPVLTFASGPTNSMRGAAFLSGLEGRDGRRHRRHDDAMSAR